MKLFLIPFTILLVIIICYTNTGNALACSGSSLNGSNAHSPGDKIVQSDFKNRKTDKSVPLAFGLNAIYNDDVLQGLINRNVQIGPFLQKYHVQFLRFPGGTPARNFFWDKPELISKALASYASDLKQRSIDENSEKFNKKAQANEAKSQTQTVSPKLYTDYVNYCSANNIIPIIQLNTYFVHDGNSIHKIVMNSNGKVDESLWTMILNNIQSQVKFTHTLTTKTIFWEIGNEDNYIYSPEAYGEIAGKYADVIKKLYPDDKVIIQTANPNQDNDWNKTVITTLRASGSIKNIDFLAPHYYKDLDNDVNSPDDIQKRFTRVAIYNNTQMIADLLTSYPQISIFYTEFGIFRRVSHSNYNTQLNALLMLDYMMQFNASPDMYGVIRHGFTQKATAFFFDKTSADQLGYNIANNDMSESNGVFGYISAEAKAEKIFLNENPAKADGYKSFRNYAYTVSSSGNNGIVNILNYSNSPITISLPQIVSGLTASQVNVSTYTFDGMSKKDCNVQKMTKTQKAGNVAVGAYTYAVITWNK